jgi:sulfur relay (sulfurtransferase) complex TusBCD TusD component (DsrE family)
VRGIEEDRLVKGAYRSSMEELTEWVGWADKVVNFLRGGRGERTVAWC